MPADQDAPRDEDNRERHDDLVRERHQGLARERSADLSRGLRDDLVREHRPPRADGDRPDPPSTAERFYPQADPQALVRSELGDADDGWYATEPPPPGGSRRRDESPAAAPERPGEGSAPGDGGSTAQEGAEGVSGPDLARAVLDAALAKRRDAAARNPRRRTGSGEGQGTGRRPRGYSGPGPDPRDPQLFGDMLQRLMKARGWERPKAEATVFGAWEKVVGPDIAKHSRPVKLDAGVLTVEAESTAWATQLRLLAATLLRNIAKEIGHNVVTRLNIHGPAAPSWNKGPRRVQGRGPRDTYG